MLEMGKDLFIVDIVDEGGKAQFDKFLAGKCLESDGPQEIDVLLDAGVIKRASSFY